MKMERVVSLKEMLRQEEMTDYLQPVLKTRSFV